MSAPTVPAIPTAVPSPSGPGRPGSPDLLRSVFRQHAAGVAVITAQDGGRPVGFTATSLNSVSADPPLLSFTIATGASSWPAVRDSEHLASTYWASTSGSWPGCSPAAEPTVSGPARAGPSVRTGCRCWTAYWRGWCAGWWPGCAGEHRVIIAEAVVGDPTGEGRPLLYHQGRFNALRD